VQSGQVVKVAMRVGQDAAADDPAWRMAGMDRGSNIQRHIGVKRDGVILNNSSEKQKNPP
jgi:hypothetical protein